MEFTFLVPLTIGLIVVYRAWGSNHDIAHLAIIFAVASLLAGLLLAPWEVQVILLILIGIVAKLLWQNFDDKNDFQDPKNTENKDANRHYRGISYESIKTNTPISIDTKITKCYRGIDYESPGTSTEKVNEIPDKGIKYRGVDIKTPLAKTEEGL